jgi:hypothetical protein
LPRNIETRRPRPGLQAYASLEDHRLLPRGARWVEGERWRAGAAAVASLLAAVLTEMYLWGGCFLSRNIETPPGTTRSTDNRPAQLTISQLTRAQLRPAPWRHALNFGKAVGVIGGWSTENRRTDCVRRRLWTRPYVLPVAETPTAAPAAAKDTVDAAAAADDDDESVEEEEGSDASEDSEDSEDALGEGAVGAGASAPVAAADARRAARVRAMAPAPAPPRYIYLFRIHLFHDTNRSGG